MTLALARETLRRCGPNTLHHAHNFAGGAVHLFVGPAAEGATPWNQASRIPVATSIMKASVNWRKRVSSKRAKRRMPRTMPR